MTKGKPPISKSVLEIAHRIEACMPEAEAAARVAFEDVLRTWPKAPGGYLRDTAGVAFAYVRASRSLKKALLHVGLVRPTPGLDLIIGAFDVPEQSLTAQEKAIEAGIAVLNAQLGDHGRFFLVSRMD